MIRLFAGLAIPPEIAGRLAGLAGGVPGARWIEPENMHVTLKFIGDVGEGVAEDIDAALAGLRAPPFDLSIRGMGFFGKSRGARMLWAGVEPSEPLLRLHGKIETALAATGIAREERKFAPHVTIARLRNAPAPRVEGFVADHMPFQAGPIRIDAFVLFSSFLSSSGAQYTPEVTYELNDSF